MFNILRNNSMLYLSGVLKWVITIYVIQKAALVRGRHQSFSIKYKIDDFIDKLLTSKKFDVLAEKFAQKAVERMIQLKPNLRFSKDFLSQIDAPEEITLKNISHNTDVHLEETLLPLKNLSLKFKHFTKGIYDEQSNERTEEAMIEAKTKKSTDVEKKKEKDDDESINLSELDSTLQDEPENRTASLGNNVQKESENISKGNKTIKQAQSESWLSVENKNNAVLSKSNLSVDHKPHEGYASGAVSDFDKNVRKDHALFSDESRDVIKSMEPNKPQVKRIHKEGNRLYTFKSSSEYEEYHQELERAEKQRTVFV